MIPEMSPAQDSITRVWASNFRSIERVDLELTSLTVLAGPNASGKSNVVDILRFLRDAATKGIELTITDRGGIKSVRRRTTDGVTVHTEMGFRYQGRIGSAEYSFLLGEKSGGGYRIRKERLDLEYYDGRNDYETLTVELRDGRLAVSDFFHQPREASSGDTISYQDAEFSRWSIGDDFGEQGLVLVQNSTSISRGFLPAIGFIRESRPNIPGLGSGLRRIFARFFNHVKNMGFYRIFPNSLRGPQRMQEGKSLLEGGENLASTLLNMQRSSNRFLPDLNRSLNYISPSIRDVRVSSAGSYLVVELEHGDAANGNESIWFDLSEQSDGTLRMLGLLVALFQDPPPTLFAIEEPEMNIHPGGLIVLMDTVAEAMQRGQVLITTHSPDLLDMVPASLIRAVSNESGATRVGLVADYQVQSITDGLFSAGELHSMEGLRVASTGKS